ncbi:MAG: hypothetical protein LBI33_06075, partial [Propionibacteriaceae bacterium]|nr:hypothetical protein [Propionibacteriaceae bacterium]
PTTPGAEPSEPLATPDAPTTTATTPTPQAASHARSWTWLWWTVGGLAASGVVVALVWLVIVLTYSPERAWRVIRRRGLQTGCLTEGMSVRVAVARLGSRLGRDVGPGLERLRDHLEAARYGPPDATGSSYRGRDLWRLRQTVLRHLKP